MVVAMNENAKKADFDPYHKWLGIPPQEQPPTHYRLLGLQAFESDAEVIHGAVMRQSAHLKTYQLGQHAALTQKLLNDVSAAKVCLMDPRRKAAYDAELREALKSREKASPAAEIPLTQSQPSAAAAPTPASPAKAIPLSQPETVRIESARPTVDSTLTTI